MGYQFRASRSETATEVSSTVIDSENFRELRDATKPPHTIAFCMINPNENDLTRDEPLPTQLQSGEEEIGSSGREQFRRATKKISTTMSHTWDETKEKAGRAREHTEHFVRENPVPTILGALGLGIAIGLAIRYASTSEQKAEIEMKSPLANLNWSLLSLPFLWPLFKSAREKYESSAEAMKDGVERLKKIDVDRYAKPIRKRWKAWTR
jgi:ElaB/YqjD/DUF883 family membrane-anchored ribosome-binding protein